MAKMRILTYPQPSRCQVSSYREKGSPLRRRVTVVRAVIRDGERCEAAR